MIELYCTTEKSAASRTDSTLRFLLRLYLSFSLLWDFLNSMHNLISLDLSDNQNMINSEAPRQCASNFQRYLCCKDNLRKYYSYHIPTFPGPFDQQRLIAIPSNNSTQKPKSLCFREYYVLHFCPQLAIALASLPISLNL